MILLMKTNRTARIFSVILGCGKIQLPVDGGQLPVYRKLVTQAAWLERAFLGKRVAGKGCALRCLDDFHADGWGIGSGDSGGSQHGVLGEDFCIDFCDQIVLAIGVAAPYLSELNGADCHGIFLTLAGVSSRLTGGAGRVNCPRGYRGTR